MEQNWQQILKIIKAQISIGNYKTWFSKTTLKSDQERLVIAVPSSFIKEQIQTKYLNLLTQTIFEVYQQPKEFEMVVMGNPKITGEEESLPEELLNYPTFNLPQASHGLNPKLSLENFVVGLSNNLAFAAAQAIVQNPGLSYNPLFIYGGTGVGKTHLMQGIGNALLSKNPHIKIIYCSSEKFMNDFIQSIQTKKTGDFRSRYRLCDLLLIDDIQFISGRDSTQEEFFHTFNELHTKNSQIILTSDRTPEEMHDLEQRLRSRFQGGLMVDIQMPDFDTRVAILRAKCQQKGDFVAEEALTLLAEAMPTNARELEGKLIQIVQIAKLNREPITTEFIKKFLGQPIQGLQKIDQKKIISEINSYFNIKMVDLIGPRRKKELVMPRQVAMYLLHEECGIPYEKIGQLLGGRDHTTILHGVEKMREVFSRDREMQRILIEIKKTLQV